MAICVRKGRSQGKAGCPQSITEKIRIPAGFLRDHDRPPCSLRCCFARCKLRISAATHDGSPSTLPMTRAEMIRISRRDILLASTFVCLGGLPTASAQQLTRVRVGKAIDSSFLFAGLELGAKQGIWRSVGLDVQISSFRGDGQMQQALAAGSIDFGLGSGPGMGYVTKGVPARAVAVLANRPSNMALVVSKASRVTKIDDIKGKRIGVSTAGSLTDWLARHIAASRNWKPSDIEIVPMGEMRTRLAAMRSGELAGAVTSVEEAHQIQDNGQGTVLTTFGEVVPNFHTHVVFARDEKIDKDPDLVRRFLRGWFTVAAYMRTHRTETVKSMAATMRISEKVVNESYDDEIAILSADGQFDPKALEVIRSSLKDLGILDTMPVTAALYTGKFVPVKLN